MAGRRGFLLGQWGRQSCTPCPPAVGQTILSAVSATPSGSGPLLISLRAHPGRQECLPHWGRQGTSLAGARTLPHGPRLRSGEDRADNPARHVLPQWAARHVLPQWGRQSCLPSRPSDCAFLFPLQLPRQLRRRPGPGPLFGAAHQPPALGVAKNVSGCGPNLTIAAQPMVKGLVLPERFTGAAQAPIGRTCRPALQRSHDGRQGGRGTEKQMHVLGHYGPCKLGSGGAVRRHAQWPLLRWRQ